MVHADATKPIGLDAAAVPVGMHVSVWDGHMSAFTHGASFGNSVGVTMFAVLPYSNLPKYFGGKCLHVPSRTPVVTKINAAYTPAKNAHTHKMNADNFKMFCHEYSLPVSTCSTSSFYDTPKTTRTTSVETHAWKHKTPARSYHHTRQSSA